MLYEVNTDNLIFSFKLIYTYTHTNVSICLAMENDLKNNYDGSPRRNILYYIIILCAHRTITLYAEECYYTAAGSIIIYLRVFIIIQF